VVVRVRVRVRVVVRVRARMRVRVWLRVVVEFPVNMSGSTCTKGSAMQRGLTTTN
jgi:hypothetical protein